MGRFIHDAVVFSSFVEEHARRARSHAESLDLNPTPVVGPLMNGWCSFLIPPDGSKVGWGHRDQAAGARDEFEIWLEREMCADRIFCDWVHVTYGETDEDYTPRIEGGSHESHREE